MKRLHERSTMAWAWVALAGCGGHHATPSSVSSSPPDTEGGVAGAPLYALSSATSDSSGGAGESTYVVLVHDLEASTTADYARAIEIPDLAFVYGQPSKGSFFTVQKATPLVTRYDVDANGAVTRGPQLDLINQGLTAASTARSIHFVSDTKAYLLDDTSLQAIVFDPSAMRVTSTIHLDGLGRDGFLTNFAYVPKQRGDQLVLGAYHFDASYAHAAPGLDLALLDVTTDQVQIVKDPRCGGFSNSVMTDDGDLYFGSDPYLGALRRLGGDDVPEPCVLRLRAGQSAVDPGYEMSIAAVSGGQAGGGVVPGPGSTAYLLTYDEGLVPLAPGLDPYTMIGAAAWVYKRVDLTQPSQASTPVNGLGAGSGNLQYFAADGHAYVAATSGDFSTSTVVDMQSSNTPVKGVAVRGLLEGIVRVR